MFSSLKDIKLLVDILERMQKWSIVNKVLKKFKKTNPKILIIGPGGVGKSTLGKVLNGQNSILDKHTDYKESLDFEVLSIDSENKADLEIPPGQKNRLKTMWQNIGRNIEDGVYTGIIFVCSYGFHSIGNLDYKMTSDYATGDSKKEFLKKYTSNRRNLELELLALISSSIITNSKAMWLLNFIGKQDLWYQKNAEVETHYNSGKYSDIIKEIELKKHESNFRVETVFGCLTIDSFFTARGVELCKNCPGYGNKQQSASLQRLFDMVNALLMWKKQ